MCQSSRLWLFSASTYNPSHIYTTHLQFTIYNPAHIYTTHLQVSIFILKSYISCSVCFKSCWSWNQACFAYYMQHQQQNTRSNLFPMSIFIGPESYHWQCSLTHSCLVNLIDVTLACEDAISKLVEAVTIADVDFRHKVWSGFWSWSSGEILKLRFGQYLAADV